MSKIRPLLSRKSLVKAKLVHEEDKAGGFLNHLLRIFNFLLFVGSLLKQDKLNVTCVFIFPVVLCTVGTPNETSQMTDSLNHMNLYSQIPYNSQISLR